MENEEREIFNSGPVWRT